MGPEVTALPLPCVSQPRKYHFLPPTQPRSAWIFQIEGRILHELCQPSIHGTCIHMDTIVASQTKVPFSNFPQKPTHFQTPTSAGPLEANLTCKMQQYNLGGWEWVRESFWYCTASVIFSNKYHHEPNIQHPKIWIRLLCLTTFWTTINLAQALALALRVVDAVLQANLTSHITMRSHLQGAKHIGCSQKSLPAWNDGTKHPSTT